MSRAARIGEERPVAMEDCARFTSAQGKFEIESPQVLDYLANSWQQEAGAQEKTENWRYWTNFATLRPTIFIANGARQ